MNKSAYNSLLSSMLKESRELYGARLRALAIFGSYARNAMHLDSDIDILIIATGLPKGRMKRVAQFDRVEKKLVSELSLLAAKGHHCLLSPIFKTPQEARAGSPLFLDMTEEIEILFERNHFLTKLLDALRKRLHQLGSQRIWVDNMWYWNLKPDLKPGEIFTI